MNKLSILQISNIFLLSNLAIFNFFYSYERICYMYIFMKRVKYLIREKKTGHKTNRVKLLAGGNFSHLHIKLVTFPRLNFGF